jgi:hypothetical protein
VSLIGAEKHPPSMSILALGYNKGESIPMTVKESITCPSQASDELHEQDRARRNYTIPEVSTYSTNQSEPSEISQNNQQGVKQRPNVLMVVETNPSKLSTSRSRLMSLNNSRT